MNEEETKVSQNTWRRWGSARVLQEQSITGDHGQNPVERAPLTPKRQIKGLSSTILISNLPEKALQKFSSNEPELSLPP